MNEKLDIVFNNFIEDKYIDVDDFISENPNLFHCQIYYKKYNQSVNGAAAKVIYEYQKFIYNLASYVTFGKKDARCLTKENKQKLEVVFSVNSGSSDLRTDFINQVKGVLNMIPESQRAKVFIACILFFFSYLGYSKYIDYQKNRDDNSLMERVAEKLATKDAQLLEIIKNSEKPILNTLPEIDETLVYQGTSYDSEDFKKIKNAKYPRIRSEKKLASLEGNFVVTQINIKKHYILIEDENEEPKKILYNDDLVAGMQGFKDKFKEAIDEEGKVFYIRAGYITQNNHPKDLCLYDIQEKNDK